VQVRARATGGHGEPHATLVVKHGRRDAFDVRGSHAFVTVEKPARAAGWWLLLALLVVLLSGLLLLGAAARARRQSRCPVA